MHRWIILAAVVGLAVANINCGNSPNSGSLVSPSATNDAGAGASVDPQGKGGKGGTGGTSGGGTGTLQLVMVTDQNNDGLPNYRDTVTFDVNTTATLRPWVTLRCYQNGTLVYQQSNAIIPTSSFTLGSQLWQSGAASCTANLENWDAFSTKGTITVLASMSFAVGA